MPGKPLPSRAPAAPTPATQRADQAATNEQIDRRINRDRARELLVHVSPDSPGHKVGRLWLRPREQA